LRPPSVRSRRLSLTTMRPEADDVIPRSNQRLFRDAARPTPTRIMRAVCAKASRFPRGCYCERRDRQRGRQRGRVALEPAHLIVILDVRRQWAGRGGACLGDPMLPSTPVLPCTRSVRPDRHAPCACSLLPVGLGFVVARSRSCDRREGGPGVGPGALVGVDRDVRCSHGWLRCRLQCRSCRWV
jgi:hypothetical protein